MSPFEGEGFVHTATRIQGLEIGHSSISPYIDDYPCTFDGDAEAWPPLSFNSISQTTNSQVENKASDSRYFSFDHGFSVFVVSHWALNVFLPSAAASHLLTK